MFWCGLTVGLILGAMIGLLTTAVLVAGKEED